MFRADIFGERRGGAALEKSGAAVWVTGTFGDRYVGGTHGLSISSITPLCVVLEGMGGYRLSGVATLGGDIKATIEGGDILRRGQGLMGDATLNFSGAGLSAGAGR